MSADLEYIGLMGVGIMGSGMADNLLKNDFPLSLFNRTEQRLSPFLDRGARIVSKPAELRNRSNIILSCVTDAAALETLIFGPDGVTTTAVGADLLIDLSTIAPGEALEISERLKKHGITFMDAPVSGGDVGARAGTLTVMAGGSPRAFERAYPIFEALGKKIVHTGPVGSGQMTKCINQIAVGLSVAALSEGLFLAEKSGLNLEKTLDVISSGAAGSWALKNYAPRVLAGDLKPGFFARDMLKDLRIALREAEKLGVELPGSQVVKQLYEDLCDGDGATLGNHALIKLLRDRH